MRRCAFANPAWPEMLRASMPRSPPVQIRFNIAAMFCPQFPIAVNEDCHAAAALQGFVVPAPQATQLQQQQPAT
ncbi:hypothetical protein ACRAVF_29525 [Bradyrhizobium oligotrophicum S58]